MRLGTLGLLAGLTVASVLVVVLARANRDLSVEARRARGQAALPQVRDAVPTVRVVTLDGDSLVLAGGEGSQLLFVFNTTCAFCLETLPVWDSLSVRLRGVEGLRVLGVSLHPDSLTRPYVQEQGLGVPVVRLPDERTERIYRFTAVPLTVLLDSTGTVHYVRGGALSVGAVDSLMAGVRQLGLIPGAVQPSLQE